MQRAAGDEARVHACVRADPASDDGWTVCIPSLFLGLPLHTLAWAVNGGAKRHRIAAGHGQRRSRVVRDADETCNAR